MFNIVQKHQKAVQIILLLTMSGFAFFGIANYLNFSSDAYIAKVGSHKIYYKDLEKYDVKNEQEKTHLLMQLVNNQLLITEAQSKQMLIPAKQVQKAIMQIPDFMTNKTFDLDKYKAFIKSNDISATKIEDIVRDQEVVNNWLQFYKNSYFAADEINNELLNLISKEVSLEQNILTATNFLDQVTVTESEINNYYQKHLNNYQLPAYSKISFIKLQVNDVLKNVTINDLDITNYLKDHPDTKLPAPQYHAAHILLAIDSHATAETIQATKKKADDIIEKIRKDPSKFASYAKQYSTDQSSAVNGGDLGFFDANNMVPEFKNKIITMKVGEISEPVKTQFGFHIIKMIAIKDPSLVQKEAIKSKLIKQKAEELLKNIYNNYDINSESNINNIANQYNQTISDTKILINSDNTVADFNNSQFQKIIEDYHNNEINHQTNNKVQKILLNNNAYFFIIQQFQSAEQQPMTAVIDDIKQQIKLPQAFQLANQYGSEEIKKLEQGQSKLIFKDKTTVNLMSGSANITEDTIRQLFNYTGKYPYYIQGVTKKGDNVIYKVNSIAVNQKLLEQNKVFLPQMMQQNYMQQLALLVDNLKNEYSVSLKLNKI